MKLKKKEKPHQHTLYVCTDEQKNLLEKIATRHEKNNWKYENIEAALVHLFFYRRRVFDPWNCPSCVNLTHEQLINLKEDLEFFLSGAEELGFELELKEAIDEIETEIINCSHTSTQRKIRWKGYCRLLGIDLVFFLISLTFTSYGKALGIGCFAACLFVAGENLIKHILDTIEKRNALRHSKILRKLHSKEIKSHQKRAEDHLKRIGWLE